MSNPYYHLSPSVDEFLIIDATGQQPQIMARAKSEKWANRLTAQLNSGVIFEEQVKDQFEVIKTIAAERENLQRELLQLTAKPEASEVDAAAVEPRYGFKPSGLSDPRIGYEIDDKQLNAIIGYAAYSSTAWTICRALERFDGALADKEPAAKPMDQVRAEQEEHETGFETQGDWYVRKQMQPNGFARFFLGCRTPSKIPLTDMPSSENLYAVRVVVSYMNRCDQLERRYRLERESAVIAKPAKPERYAVTAWIDHRGNKKFGVDGREECRMIAETIDEGIAAAIAKALNEHTNLQAD